MTGTGVGNGLTILIAAALMAAAVLIWPPGGPTPHADDAEPSVDDEDRHRAERSGNRAARAGFGRRSGRSRPAAIDGITVADTLDLLAYALAGGASVVECLEVVAAQSDPEVAGVLRQVSAAQRWGVDPAAAWASVGTPWAAAGQALSLADRTGAAPAALLESAAVQVREQRAHQIEVAGARLGVRIVIPLGLCFLPAFVLLTVVPAVVATAGAVLSEL